MYLDDLRGSTHPIDEATLNLRLRSVRKGTYGAFVLRHTDSGPSLWVHLNGDIAYLHFFPSGHDHPGFQPKNMTPAHCEEVVHFLLTNGSEGDSIDLPRSTLVSADAAYVAAMEFFRMEIPPPSIQWFEL